MHVITDCDHLLILFASLIDDYKVFQKRSTSDPQPHVFPGTEEFNK